tara:strand:+ start:8886 stop:10931 length:2046 start_codon:yes stop_codon:yes gene_type:complete
LKNKIIAIIQCRLNSRRLPNKAILKLNKVPVIIRMLNRVKKSKLINEIWVATGISKENDKLCKLLLKKNIRTFRGDDNNVLSRFMDIASKTKAKYIVRLTADCPLVDASIIDKAITSITKYKLDYVSNILKRTYPDGLDVEVFSRNTLKKTFENVTDDYSKEHVTTYMHGLHKKKYKKGQFKKFNIENAINFSHMRWTLDEEKDFHFINDIFCNLKNDFFWEDVLEYLTKYPEKLIRNNMIGTGLKANKVNKKKKAFLKSNKLFKRAINTVPLASQTFSKSYTMWPKGNSPLFFDRGHGARVVDPDGNHYIDYILGLLPITLGYCDPDVDNAVIQQIMKGTIFSLPSTLEMKLSELLVSIIPSAEMVRFGKNGSDATTAAIRLARAFTNRDLIAVAGYHGWHDWYIGSSSRNLGVPKSVEKLTKKFTFNDAESLKYLLSKYHNKFACVILEPSGLIDADKSFLKSVRELCNKHKVVLIFDEVISGFRINLGGAQKKYNVIPDLSCFGKGMANGYPISAIVGKRKIMKIMKEIFFSTTFGGETLSITAALTTIKKLKRLNIVEKNINYGKLLSERLNKIINASKLKNYIEISKVYWWPRIILKDIPITEDLAVSLLRQEFIEQGLFLGSTFNICYAHTKNNILKLTTESFHRSIENLSVKLLSKNPKIYLKGDTIEKTFKVR